MQASLTIAVLIGLLGGTVLWLWALADTLTHPHPTAYRRGNQLAWSVIIALTHAVGAVLYLALGRGPASPREAHR